MKRYGGMLRAIAASIALAPLPPADAAVILAQNGQVLDQYQQAAGGQQAQLVREADGSTRIAWTGSVTLDYYSSHSSGGSLLTPVTGGNHARVIAQGDVRGQSADGDVSYFQFANSNSNDPMVQSYPNLVQHLQGGRVGPGYQIIGGDIAAQFSTLGTNVGLRGLFGARQFGSTTVSATAGVLGDSWESVAGSAPRPRPLRNAYASKVDHAISQSWTAFVTAQGYDDAANSADESGFGMLPETSGQATTLGLAYRQGTLSIAGELGVSRWNDGLQQSQWDAGAGVVDATWEASPTLGLRFGHHDLGRYYTSLSAMAVPGIRESYGGVNWSATPWFSLNGDLRRAKNRWAATGIAEHSDMATVAASAFIPQMQSLSFTLQASQSQGENPGGTRNDSGGYSAGTRYTASLWQAGLTASRSRIDNDDMPGFNGDTDGINIDAGLLLGDATAATPGVWSANLNLGLGLQDNDLDAGVRTSGFSVNAGVSVQHARWGSMLAAYTYNITGQPSGLDLKTHGVQLEASRTVMKTGLLKFYFRSNRRIDEAGVLDYRDETAGLQLVLAY